MLKKTAILIRPGIPHCCVSVMHDYWPEGQRWQIFQIKGHKWQVFRTGGQQWEKLKRGHQTRHRVRGATWRLTRLKYRGKRTNCSVLANRGSKNLFVCGGGSYIDSFVAVVTSSEKIVAPLIGSCPTPPSGSSLSGQNDRDLCDKKIERFYLPTTFAVKSLM